MKTDPIAEMLVAAGFVDGWVLADGQLVIWEHEQNPPEPLTRPTSIENKKP